MSFPLFNKQLLSESRIIELGSGTGMLTMLLSPLCLSYTATDLYENMRLVSRNIELNQRSHGRPAKGTEIALEELDWVATSTSKYQVESVIGKGYDLVLAVDCIYNEYLTGPFIETLSTLCPEGDSTMALVVVELRSADVVSSKECEESLWRGLIK